MKKKSFIVLLVLIACILRADDFEKIEQLKKEKEQIDLLMHKTRVKLIKSTPSLLTIKKKIIDLHKELAIRIDNTSEMRKLISRKEKIKSELAKLGE